MTGFSPEGLAKGEAHWGSVAPPEALRAFRSEEARRRGHYRGKSTGSGRRLRAWQGGLPPLSLPRTRPSWHRDWAACELSSPALRTHSLASGPSPSRRFTGSQSKGRAASAGLVTRRARAAGRHARNVHFPSVQGFPLPLGASFLWGPPSFPTIPLLR